MITETATVTKIDGRQVEIEMQRQSVCGGCELNSGCGTGAIGRLLGRRNKPLKIFNQMKLMPGDQVVIGIRERAYLNASLIIYGLPLLGLIVGGLLSQWIFGESDLIALIGAAIGLSFSLIASAMAAKYRFSEQVNPKILQVIGEPKD